MHGLVRGFHREHADIVAMGAVGDIASDAGNRVEIILHDLSLHSFALASFSHV